MFAKGGFEAGLLACHSCSSSELIVLFYVLRCEREVLMVEERHDSSPHYMHCGIKVLCNTWCRFSRFSGVPLFAGPSSRRRNVEYLKS